MFDTMRIMLGKRREYRRNAKMSAHDFAAMKLVKFRKLVAHAATHSPYYQTLIADHNIKIESCTPEDFPELTKSLLMENFDNIVTDKRITRQSIADFLSHSTDPAEIFLNTFNVIHTSGSSGEMGYFIYSLNDWNRGMSMSMRPRLPGSPAFDRKKRARKGRIRIAYYAAVGGHFAGVSMMTGLQKGLARFFIKADLFEVNSPMADTVDRLNTFQPGILAGYTGALLLLARQQQVGNLQIKPNFISTAGEGMSPADKSILESTFGGIASNGYGSSEHLIMGMDIPGASSMLLPDDDLLYELKPDCTLISNLFNFTLPLIRYRMSDILKPVSSKTFPDLPYLEIESLIGRTEIMPVFINDNGEEDSLHPITIAEIFVAGVQRFQLRWLSSTQFHFLVCLDPALNRIEKETTLNIMTNCLREILEQKLMSKVNFEVLPVDELAVNPKTRKFQLIADDRQ